MSSGLLALARMAARNVRKHWRHSLGSILSIAVGFVAIGLFSGYLDDLAWRQMAQLSKKSMMGDIIIEHQDASDRAHSDDVWGHQLGANEQAFIDAHLARERSQVATRARFLEVVGLASTGKAGVVFLGQGHDVAEGALLRGDLRDNAKVGAPLDPGADDQVLLGQGLGAALDCAPAEALAPGAVTRALACRRARAQLTATTESGQLNVIEPRVVGLTSVGVKEYDARLLVMSLPAAQRLMNTGAVSRYHVQLTPGVDAAAFAARLEHAAQAEGVRLRAQRWQDHRFGDQYTRGMTLLSMFRSFVVVIVVAIAAMSVLMTMMRAVAERTREVGMLRSLGFLRREVMLLFLLEAGMLALVSCAVGALSTAALTWACNHAGITYNAGMLSDAIPLAVAFVPSVWLTALCFLSTVAMLATVLPARRAARMPIPEALGHV
ncbi:MAG: ABC transporter permease [Deltaproteobacteria bacterium]|nr:ABC transporter permease [Deltaproteobacteria bacterium]